jgi:hypothetical protein
MQADNFITLETRLAGKGCIRNDLRSPRAVNTGGSKATDGFF